MRRTNSSRSMIRALAVSILTAHLTMVTWFRNQLLAVVTSTGASYDPNDKTQVLEAIKAKMLASPQVHSLSNDSDVTSAVPPQSNYVLEYVNGQWTMKLISISVDTLEKELQLNRLLNAIANDLSGQAVNTVAVAFTQETDIDTGVSFGYAYDATGMFVKPYFGIYDAIPVMTGYTTPSGTAAAQSEFSAGYAAWRCFDDSVSGGAWIPTSGTYATWVTYEFPSGPIPVDSFLLRIHNYRSINTFNFEGWNGSSWDVLYTETGGVKNDWFVDDGSATWLTIDRIFSITYTEAYLKFRVNVLSSNADNAVNNNFVGFQDIQIGLLADGNAGIISPSATISSGTTSGSVFALTKANEAVVYGTDVTFSLSRDDGSNWDEIAISKVGTGWIVSDGTVVAVDILYGAAAIAGADAQLGRVRCDILNKDLELYGMVGRFIG